MTNQCTGCQRGLPVHNGIHIAECEMFTCTSFSAFDLEPMTRESWSEGKRVKRDDVPFTCGGQS